MGVSQKTVSRRMQELEVAPKQPKGDDPRKLVKVTNLPPSPEPDDAEGEEVTGELGGRPG